MGMNKKETIKYNGYNTGKYFSDLVINPLICDKCNSSRVLSLMDKHTGRTLTWCAKCNTEYDEEYISLPCESNDYWDSLPNHCYEVHWIEKEYSDDLVSFMIKLVDIIDIDESKYKSYNMHQLKDAIISRIRQLKITEEQLVPFKQAICNLLGSQNSLLDFRGEVISKIEKLLYNEKHKHCMKSVLHKNRGGVNHVFNVERYSSFVF